MSFAARAQADKLYRVGVVLPGGPYYQAIDGLRDGLSEFGFVEGKQYVLHIRDEKGELTAAADAARSLEQEKIDIIFALPASVTGAVKAATENVPIVFFAGSDPVESGLVKSLTRPGGRLTGINLLSSELISKRIEILKEISPKLRRVLTFYDPNNPVARETSTSARRTAQQLGIGFLGREVHSIEELRTGLRTLESQEGDALFVVSDGMVISQSQLIVDVARAKRLPTMFGERSGVLAGGLASYGVNYRSVGHLAAKYVHKVLLGARPEDLPVERIDRFELVVNARTARELGLELPASVVIRAEEVIR